MVYCFGSYSTLSVDIQADDKINLLVPLLDKTERGDRHANATGESLLTIRCSAFGSWFRLDLLARAESSLMGDGTHQKPTSVCSTVVVAAAQASLL